MTKREIVVRIVCSELASGPRTTWLHDVNPDRLSRLVGAAARVADDILAKCPDEKAAETRDHEVRGFRPEAMLLP